MDNNGYVPQQPQEGYVPPQGGYIPPQQPVYGGRSIEEVSCSVSALSLAVFIA